MTARSKLLKSCTFIEYSDLVGVAFTQDESDSICESLNNSEMSFGNNNRTMASLGRMCELVRCTDDIERKRAETICATLTELLKPGEYIDIEN